MAGGKADVGGVTRVGQMRGGDQESLPCWGTPAGRGGGLCCPVGVTVTRHMVYQCMEV